MTITCTIASPSAPETRTFVSCVIVKTKTRSKKSSSVDTRAVRSGSTSDTGASSRMSAGVRLQPDPSSRPPSAQVERDGHGRRGLLLARHDRSRCRVERRALGVRNGARAAALDDGRDLAEAPAGRLREDLGALARLGDGVGEGLAIQLLGVARAQARAGDLVRAGLRRRVDQRGGG